MALWHFWLIGYGPSFDMHKQQRGLESQHLAVMHALSFKYEANMVTCAGDATVSIAVLCHICLYCDDAMIVRSTCRAQMSHTACPCLMKTSQPKANPLWSFMHQVDQVRTLLFPLSSQRQTNSMAWSQRAGMRASMSCPILPEITLLA